jgi:23S rRNA U2552 (ribose-2'-O)-methylase RlmE/FtsJ
VNDLEKYFRLNDKRIIHKWNHYFDVYDRYFRKYRNKDIVILEIGVSQGGSLQMWKDYFGDKAKIFGIDINPCCKELEEENIKIFIGSQSDRFFLRDLLTKIPPIDILIDDGGHTMVQQITSYEELFNHIKDDGVYLCEDLHTSYWFKYGGGYKRKGTFIEYSKNFIDSINAHHSHQKKLKVDAFTQSVYSIHYYDSIIVIEKRPKVKSYHEKSGKITFEKNIIPENIFLKIRKKGVQLFLKSRNKLFRFF